MDERTFVVEVLKYTSPVIVALIGAIPYIKRKNAQKGRSKRSRKGG